MAGYLQGPGTRTRAEVVRAEEGQQHPEQLRAALQGRAEGRSCRRLIPLGGEEPGSRLRGQGWSEDAYQEKHQAQGPPATKTSLPGALNITKGLSCGNDPGYTLPKLGPFPSRSCLLSILTYQLMFTCHVCVSLCQGFPCLPHNIPVRLGLLLSPIYRSGNWSYKT